MSARELHDDLKPHGSASWTIIGDEDRATILRSLKTQAAVDESSDGLVRELRDWSRIYGNPYALAYDRAAARIVALEAELASVKAERDAMLHDLETSEGLMCCDNHEGHSLFELKHPSAEAYRAANPKE